MKHWFINLILLSIAIGIGIGLFLMKQRVVEYEKELNRLHNLILADRREIHTLKADWAILTEPSRLRHLLAQTSVQQIQATQIVETAEVELTPLAVPPKKPFKEAEEPVESKISLQPIPEEDEPHEKK